MPRYVLVEDDGERRIPCVAAEGVFTGPAGEPLRLWDCTLPDDLGERLRTGRKIPPALFVFAAVDRFGIETELSLVRFDLAEWSLRGAHHADLVLREPLHDPPSPAAEPIWQLWSAGRPQAKNLWAGHDRVEWLRAAVAHHRAEGPDRPSGRTYRLDGTHVTDTKSYYCALGEAVNGPGGYFGWNLDALADCLRGGFGATPPFTVVGPEVPHVREVFDQAGVTLRARP
ncbi:barstar family protein [Amycolatopsis kentuckyensis]|uniref:barstar family protein n=1 Tax=Amycolatopsis kentuckyensis TaxID=218823 RepID=UPI000A3AEB1F|nr:barstar family protein [Amycolatopsis kentuckyensis]